MRFLCFSMHLGTHVLLELIKKTLFADKETKC